MRRPKSNRPTAEPAALCDQLGRSDELFPVLRGLWNCQLQRGELRRAHQLAERLVVLAEEQGAPLRRALARRALGTTLFFLGRFADAARELSEGIAIDDAVAAWEDRADLLLYTERAGVVCRLYSAWACGSWAARTAPWRRSKLGSPSANASRTITVSPLP